MTERLLKLGDIVRVDISPILLLDRTPPAPAVERLCVGGLGVLDLGVVAVAVAGLVPILLGDLLFVVGVLALLNFIKSTP